MRSRLPLSPGRVRQKVGYYHALNVPVPKDTVSWPFRVLQHTIPLTLNSYHDRECAAGIALEACQRSLGKQEFPIPQSIAITRGRDGITRLPVKVR